MAELVSLAEQISNLLFGSKCRGGTDGRNHYLMNVRDCEHLFLGRCIRHEYSVILILAHLVLPFRAQHADDAEREVAHAHRLPDRVRPCEEIIYNGLADNAYASCRSHIPFSEKLAGCHGPCANFRELGIHSLNAA